MRTQTADFAIEKEAGVIRWLVDDVLYSTKTPADTDPHTFDNFDCYTTGSGGGGTPTTMHVASIVVGTANAGQGSKRGTATVTIEDDLGHPVGSATVTGTFTGSYSETQSGATGTDGTDGTVTLTTTATQKGGVSFTFCVDTVTHGTLAYDPAANAVTCASL